VLAWTADLALSWRRLAWCCWTWGWEAVWSGVGHGCGHGLDVLWEVLLAVNLGQRELAEAEERLVWLAGADIGNLCAVCGSA